MRANISGILLYFTNFTSTSVSAEILTKFVVLKRTHLTSGNFLRKSHPNPLSKPEEANAKLFSWFFNFHSIMCCNESLGLFSWLIVISNFLNELLAVISHHWFQSHFQIFCRQNNIINFVASFVDNFKMEIMTKSLQHRHHTLCYYLHKQRRYPQLFLFRKST